MEREAGFEAATSTLNGWTLPTESHPHSGRGIYKCRSRSLAKFQHGFDLEQFAGTGRTSDGFVLRGLYLSPDQKRTAPLLG